MTRWYCDICGVEITEEPRARIRKLYREKLMVEVVTGLRPVWNGGHFCTACVIAAVNEGEPITESGAVQINIEGA